MEVIRCNNLKVVRFVNSPVPSNTYLVIDEVGGCCIVIDPGSRNPVNVVDYLRQHSLRLDYILLTHEHFDHCWGVNNLLANTNAKLVTTRLCRDWIKKPMNYFNKLYYDSDETYSISRVDIVVEDIGMELIWNNVQIVFIGAKGHTDKGMCISINDCLFTGDTMIKDTKPVIKKKYGASVKDLKETITNLYSTFSPDTIIFAGHGNSFYLKDMKGFYMDYFADK